MVATAHSESGLERGKRIAAPFLFHDASHRFGEIDVADSDKAHWLLSDFRLELRRQNALRLCRTVHQEQSGKKIGHWVVGALGH